MIHALTLTKRFSFHIDERIYFLIAAVTVATLLASMLRLSIPAIPVGAFVITAFLSPLPAALIVAALTPIATMAAGTLFSFGGDAAELLVLAFVCGAGARAALSAATPSPSPSQARRFAWLFIAVILASLLVQIVLVHMQLGWDGFRVQMLAMLGNYSGARDTQGLFAEFRSALRLTAAVLLFATISWHARGHSGAIAALTRMLVAGGAAAAALNLSRVLAGAARTDTFLSSVVTLMQTVRLSLPYSDVNAAGSHFVLILFAAVAIALAGRGVRGALAWVGAILIAIGLWLSGSRVALMALIIASGLWLAATRRLRPRILLAFAVSAIALTVVFPNRLFSVSSIGAAGIRFELARAAMKMFATAPVFGIGIGRFFDLSGGYIEASDVRALYPRENAHNNYLQILAETGAVGFIAFAGTLLSIALAVRRTAGWQRQPVVNGLVYGVIAFLLTCIGGHPLLLTEVAIAFFAALGILHASTAPNPSASRSHWLPIALVIVAISIPFRVANAWATANLEHVGQGVSPWYIDAEGNRYRTMESEATLFIPSAASVVDVPYRVDGDTPVEIDVIFRGRLAARLIARSEWQVYRLIMTGENQARYVPVILQRRTPGSTAIWIGRTVPRERTR